MNELKKTLWQRLCGMGGSRLAFVITAIVTFIGACFAIAFSGNNFEPALCLLAAIFCLACGNVAGSITVFIGNREARCRTWNEPRRFFGCLTLFSLVGLAVELSVDANHPADWLRNIALTTATILLASFALGFICMILAWVPPIHRLLTWLLQRRWFVLACLVTFVALFYAEENWRGKRAWENYRHECEAKGERFNWESIVPPPVPDEQNFALTPIVYSSYGQQMDKNGNQLRPANTDLVDRLNFNIYRENDQGDTNLASGSWQKATFTNLKPWQDFYRHPKSDSKKPNTVVTNEFPTSPEPQTPAADVVLALSKYDAAIEELREAAKLPYSRFPLAYRREAPFAIVLPHLSKTKQVALALRLRAIAELQADQPEKALADLKLALRWNDSIRNEPFLIEHLVRIAVQSLLLQPIWEGLAAHKWSAAQVIELQAALAGQDFFADFHQVMRGELTADITTIESMRRIKDYHLLMDLDGQMFDDSKKRDSTWPLEKLGHIVYFLIPDGWFYKAQLACARMHQQWILPAVDLQRRVASPTVSRHLDKAATAEISKRSVNILETIFVRMVIPALMHSHKKCALIQSQLDLAITACALERFRLAHGEFPTTLDALAPQFITQVPHDIINGQPLHYRRTDDGQFILYSVGWNETDDGGNVVLKEKSRTVDTDQGDWVWRYPAKSGN